MVGGFNIYKTIDGGNLWSPSSSIDSVFIQDLFFINTEIGWFTFQDSEDFSGGVYKTTNGGVTWNLQLTSVSEFNMEEIQFVDQSNGWCLGIWGMGTCLLYKTTNGGFTWTDTLLYINLAFGFSLIDNNTAWIAGGTINKTTDSGISWVEQFNVDPKFFSYIQFVNLNTGWGWLKGPLQETEIYKTTNGGETWFWQSDFPLNSMFFIDELFGWALVGSSIYRTSDGGYNWALQYTADNYLSNIFFLNQSKGWIVGHNGTILHTDNSGIPVELISFTSLVNNNNVTLNWQTATETNNQGFQIERSEEWQNIGFVNGKGTTTELQAYSFVDENLLAEKYQYRLKQIDFNGTFEYSNTIEADINSPTKFSLEQNYPNPFNPSTKISWQSPVGSWQTLKVFDILGNEVATLVNEEKNAGSFNIEFNAPHLASGIYYYQLRAGDFVETKKMILMR